MTMAMRVRNCPQCYGMGFRGHAGRCGYCHGKKKISSEFVKWDAARYKKEVKITCRWEEQMKIEVEEKIKSAMKKWEEKNPKPRKFV